MPVETAEKRPLSHPFDRKVEALFKGVRTPSEIVFKRLALLREKGVDLADELYKSPSFRSKLDKVNVIDPLDSQLSFAEMGKLRDHLLATLSARERAAGHVFFKVVPSRTLDKYARQSGFTHPPERATNTVLLVNDPSTLKIKGQVLRIVRGGAEIQPAAGREYEAEPGDVIVTSRGFHPTVVKDIRSEFRPRYPFYRFLHEEVAPVQKGDNIAKAGIQTWRVIMTPSGKKVVSHGALR